MSKLETPMTRAFWKTIGGTLCEEYQLVARAPNTGRRLIDGLIILGEPTRIARSSEHPNLKGRDVVLIQTKAHRLGMYLLGQALFSRELAMLVGAKSLRTVAVAAEGDLVLEPIAEKFGIEVFIVPQRPTRSTRPKARAPRRKPPAAAKNAG